MNQRQCVLAPASTSNLGPGFDTLGLALNLHLKVCFEPGHAFNVQMSGEGMGILPADSRNYVIKAAREVAGMLVDKCNWTIHSEIPVSRGLGSSAASRAAGLAAGYLLRDGKLPDPEKVFVGVSRAENHPDNAAATAYGGFQIANLDKDSRWQRSSGEWLHKDCKILLVIPEVPVSTEQARSILPKQYSRRDCVHNIQCLGTLLTGLAQGDWDAVRASCADKLHEPYRLGLVNGLADCLHLLRSNPSVGGAYLSGAGPVLCAILSDDNSFIQLGQAAVDCLEKAGTKATFKCTEIQAQGVRTSP